MRFFLFLSAILITITAYPQNVIELKNSSTGKTRILKSGTKLHFTTGSSSEYIKAKIVQIKDSVIVMYIPEYDEEMPLMDVRLTQLKAIKKPTPFHGVARGAGAIFLPVGAFLFQHGFFPLIRNDQFQGQPTYNKDEAVVSTFGGLGLIALGALPYLFKPKEYDLTGEWTISVKEASN